MELSGPRWKVKTFAKIADSNPMCQIITQLKSSLSSSKSTVSLSGTNSLLKSVPVNTDLLNRTSFGTGMRSLEKDMRIFKFYPEETFYLLHELKCIDVMSQDNKTLMSEDELWSYFVSRNKLFPVFYKAYSHLRNKNWVVTWEKQFGTDFVAYRHHPALVHSEYAVIVDFEGERGEMRGERIRNMWDLNNTIRICNSVAKTILVVGIRGFDERDLGSLSCLEKMVVDERVVTRWVPSQSRDLCQAGENDD